MRERELAAWQEPFLDLFLALARRRVVVVLALLLGVGGALFQLLTTPKFYRSSAVMVLLPREKPTLDVSVLAGSMETAEEGASRADAAPLMLPPQTDLYLSLLSSRAVLETLYERFGARLDEVGDFPLGERSDEQIRALQSMIEIEGTEEGMMTVTATSYSPELAADLCNALVEQSEHASKAIERQLLLQQAGYLRDTREKAARALADEEAVLERFLEEHRVIEPSLHANDRTRQIRELTAKVDADRAALAQRRLSFTDRDPGVKSLKAAIAANERRVEDLRGRIAGDVGEAEFGALSIRYQALMQQVRFRRDLLSTLTTQVDIFEIRAEQPSGNMAVVRPAVPQPIPAGPAKKRLLGLWLGGALALGCAAILLLEQLHALRADRALSDKWADVRRTALRPLAR